MSLILHVDGAKWRNHLATVLAESDAQVVPVIKGNGYGFGKKVLAQEAKDLNLPVVAVATVAEAKEIESVFLERFFCFLLAHLAIVKKSFIQFHRTLQFSQERCRKSLCLNSYHRFIVMVFQYLI